VARPELPSGVLTYAGSAGRLMFSSLKRNLDTLFRRQEYRVDGEATPRWIKWTLVSTRWFAVFLHRFCGPDWTRDPHNHPTDFVSIGLRGSYVETVYNANGNRLYERTWRAPWFRSFPADHIHRTSSVGPKGALTVCIVNPPMRDWGFVVDAKLVPWRDYLRSYRSKRMDRKRPEMARPPAEE
jgi:hypothetical protein